MRSCPFCGGDRLEVRDVAGCGIYAVVCLNVACETEGPSAEAEEDAVGKWTARAGHGEYGWDAIKLVSKGIPRKTYPPAVAVDDDEGGCG